MINFENVTKSFRINNGRKYVVRDLNFEFPRQNIAILGANGAGKSTLMRLMAGTELPDTGHVTRSANISWPLGFAGSFNGSLTGVENVRFVSRIYGQDTEHVIEFVKEFAELGEYFEMPVGSYSSGMKARLAFGVSMAIAFDCYLVDEITAVGDRRFKTKCKKTFNDLLTHSKIIMISHSPNTLKDYCDAGILLYGGQLYYYDDVRAAIEDHERLMKE